MLVTETWPLILDDSAVCCHPCHLSILLGCGLFSIQKLTNNLFLFYFVFIIIIIIIIIIGCINFPRYITALVSLAQHFVYLRRTVMHQSCHKLS